MQELRGNCGTHRLKDYETCTGETNSDVDKALLPSWKAGDDSEDIAPEQVFRKPYVVRWCI